MGGGDLNMKKSWHPVLLVNQEKVWKAEKAANEESRKLNELRKEREEERQLAELQRMQEEATGRKRVEKLDWMYAAPSSGEGGALGGQKVGEREMEEYLLGKKRVDQVLGQGDKNIGATSKEYIAVQNANTARDTANKIREDPLLMIKQRELDALKAMRNDPAVRARMKAQMSGASAVESKEQRKARKAQEKEERRKAKEARHERREHRRSSPYDDRDRDRSHRSHRERDHSRSPRRHRDRSVSPRRDERKRTRSTSPRRDREREHSRRGEPDVKREHDERDRVPPPRAYNNGHSNGHGHGHSHSNGYGHSNGHGSRPSASDFDSRPPTRPAPTATNPNDAARAARLAAMSSAASNLESEREKQLAERREKERLQFELEERERNKFGAADTKGAYVREQQRMMFEGGGGLGDTMTRRGGKGMLKEI